MSTSELKKHLHDQIENLDERSLEMMYSILLDYLNINKDFELTASHKELIDERLDDYEKNPQNIIGWEDSKKLIKKHL